MIKRIKYIYIIKTTTRNNNKNMVNNERLFFFFLQYINYWFSQANIIQNQFLWIFLYLMSRFHVCKLCTLF